jgi:multiple sugar transport system substrate-binding protein
MMTTRRDLLKGALGSSVVLLIAACAPSASQPSPTSAPAAAPTAAAAKPAAGASPAAAPSASPAQQPAAAPKTAPSNISGAEISLLQWNSFIPPADAFFKQQADEYAKQSGVKVTVETIDANALLPRFIASVQGQSGPSIFQTQHIQSLTLAEGLYDLTDLAKEFEPKYGKYYPQIDSNGRKGDKYYGIPWNGLPNASVYRKSWFEKAGVTKVPETYDEYDEMIKKMAAFGKPVGQAFSNSFGDPPSFCYPLLWAYGGKELETDYKVAINSKETLTAVQFCITMWKDGLDPKGMGGDDSYNNAAFLAEDISCTVNGASIYFVGAGLDGKTPPKPWADDMDHFLNPKGPAGAFEWGTTFSHAIPTYTKGKQLDAAKDYLRFIYDRKNFDPWFELQKGYSTGPGDQMQQSKMWNELPKALQPFKTAFTISRALGYAALPDGRVGEAQSKALVVNMFARAIQGLDPSESVKQAETEYKQIFG